MQKSPLHLMILCFFVSVLAPCTGYSQYVTVKLGGGYSLPGIQQSTGVLTFQPGANPDPAYSAIIPLVNFNTVAADTTKRYKSNLYDGYGHGGHFDFAVGYMFNPYFGIQIDGAYLWGSTVQATQSYDDRLLGPGASIVTRTHSNGLSLNPSLVFRAAKPTDKVAPYARAGLALPVLGAIYHDLDITSPNSSFFQNIPTTANISVKTLSSLSVGFQGVVGVSYTPTPLISIWGELNGQYLFVKAHETDLTQYIITTKGQATQDLLTTSNTINGGKPWAKYSTTINFVDQLNASSNTTETGKLRDVSGGHANVPGYVDETKAHDELRQVANFGSFGFSVGVTFNLGKKAKKKAEDTPATPTPPTQN